MKRSREPEEDEDHSSPEPEGSSDRISKSASPRVALVERFPPTKITGLDESAVDDDSETFIMRCSLPPHRDVLSFKTYAEYEAHHNRTHMNRCVECSKNFPSEHLLNVHIEECHDAFAAVKREKGEHTVGRFIPRLHYPFLTPFFLAPHKTSRTRCN